VAKRKPTARLRTVTIDRGADATAGAGVAAHPFDIPAVRQLAAGDGLDLDAPVTFLVGDNGSGKSTLVEAIAVAAGFNAEGGTRSFGFATREGSVSRLHERLRLTWSPGARSVGFFLRAESFFNVATVVEQAGVQGYGDRSLHEQSHGESFLALALHRFEPGGLYLLDEPEAALSVRGQLALLGRVHDLVGTGAQFVVATHSPILLAYPGATIYELGPGGIAAVAYDEAEPTVLTRSFLEAPERFLRHLFEEA
jgi:predicted ATPase